MAKLQAAALGSSAREQRMLQRRPRARTAGALLVQLLLGVAQRAALAAQVVLRAGQLGLQLSRSLLLQAWSGSRLAWAVLMQHVGTVGCPGFEWAAPSSCSTACSLCAALAAPAQPAPDGQEQLAQKHPDAPVSDSCAPPQKCRQAGAAHGSILERHTSSAGPGSVCALALAVQR